MLLSDYLGIDLSDFGVFDIDVEKDNHFFINIIRLRQSNIPEFVEAYNYINSFFSEIAMLLDAAEEPSDKDIMYRRARKRFAFHEVKSINLGLSESSCGSGWGNVISNKVLKDAYQIVKKGSKQPEIFHLVGLFEENIAGDRVSDMIATIIEDYIRSYTKRIMSECNITEESNPDLPWLENGLLKNPRGHFELLFLPEEVIHEIPIAREWDEIDDVISKNETIRNEISNEIGKTWGKWHSSEKKAYIKEKLFMNPDTCSRVVEAYKGKEMPEYDPRNDVDYFAELLLSKVKKSESFKNIIEPKNSYEASKEIIGIFKHWVEDRRGWKIIQNAPTRSCEKAVQSFIDLAGMYYCQTNNIDLSPETDSGRGPVDFKASRGNDKTIIEVKLSSNSQYLHGYQTQIQEYAKAEGTNKCLYVYIDKGNPIRTKKIIEFHKKNKSDGKICPELIIINAKEHKAASTHKNK